MSRIAVAGMLLLCAGGRLPADFSYQQTVRITGGMMAGAMKVAGVFSKEAREPTRTGYFVKGNRLATVSRQDAQIVDLDRETITHVDFDKKTYSVMTFAEMMELMKELESRMAREKGEQAEVSAKVSVEPTQETKTIAGVNARLVRLRVEMEGTDRKSGRREVFMTMTSEQWIAAVPGYEEVRDFYRRMAQRLAWVPSAGFPAQRAEEARALAELRKEAAALDGLAIFEVTRMHLAGEQAAALGAQQPEARPAEEQPSVGGALGRLGGLGRLGRLGRKKESPPPPAAPPAAASESGPGLLMEITAEADGFSTAPVEASRFEVPAGFKQVENELKRMRR